MAPELRAAQLYDNYLNHCLFSCKGLKGKVFYIILSVRTYQNLKQFLS